MTFLDPKARFDEINDALNALEPRVAALEDKVRTNDERLRVLEEFMVTHQAGAARRQQQVDELRRENERLRWLQQRR